MKTISIILLFMFACISQQTTAQSNIWINGYTYTEEQGKQVMIPFVTISIYDYPQTNNLKYFVVSGTHGNYSIKPFDYKKQYHYVVEAPGYKTKEFNTNPIPETNNGKPFSGNCTIHILMEKDTLHPITNALPKIYQKDELKKKGKVKSINDLLALMPEISKEGNDWITTEGKGSVCLCLNGTNLTAQTLPMLNELPTDAVSSLEYYQLPQGGIYEAVVNIMLIAGKQASAPTYTLQQSNLIF